MHTTPRAITICAQDGAIALALREGTLKVVQRKSRWGDDYWTISDRKGLIEIAMSLDEADTRIEQVRWQVKEQTCTS